MTSTDLAPQVGVLGLPQEQKGRILQALGLDLRQPLTQALLLVAEQYDLDPLLKQVQIIKSNVYITHKGLLHIAHQSGKLDGIVVEDEFDDKDYFRAKVSVYRKDMSHPFTFRGKFKKSKVASDGASGEEMALKNAERAALGRAFDVTVPTMADEGDDFDPVMPHGDIDLPGGRPDLPSAEANALPVPEMAPPTASEMPPIREVEPDPKAAAPATPSAPAASDAAAPKLPAGTMKVTIPETGEVTHLSPNGHIVNEKTGGEVFPATTDQEALQTRAREIVAEAEAALEAKVPTPGAKKVAKAVAKKAAAKKADDPGYTDEEIKRGQSIHMKAKELNIEETLMRDIVFSITEKRTRSTREVSHDEADTVKAVMTAIAGDLMELEYDTEGVLKFDMMDNPLPPDDAEIEPSNEPRDWKKEANDRHVKDGMFLRKARALAEELGITLPSTFKDIAGAELEAALWAWLMEVESEMIG